MRKNYLLFAAWAAMVIMFASCFNNAKARLGKIVAEVNKECPVPTGIGMFERVDYDGEIITFVYTIDNDMVTVDKLKQKKAEAKKVFSNNLSKKTVRQLLQEMVKAKVALRMDLTDVRSSTRMNIDFAPNELEEILKNPPGDDNELTLQSEVMLANLMTPTDIDFATVLDSVTLSKTEFTYEYTYDDTQIKPTMITEEAVSQLKSEHFQQLVEMMRLESGATLKSCIKACCETNRTFVNVYTGKNTGKVFQYSHSPKELEDAIRKSESLIDPSTLPSFNR